MSKQADFASSFDSSLSTAFGALVKATKAAGKLPADISFHRTLDEDIDSKLEKASKRTLRMANKLWIRAKADPTSMTVDSVDDIAIKNDEGSWDMGPGFRPVVDAVDNLLEKIDVGLDEVLKNPAHQLRTAATKQAASVGKQSAPVITTVAAAGGRKTDVRLLHAQNIPRPQLSFKDTIDNSPNTPFVWKIRNKVHAQVPLDYGLPSADMAVTPLGSHLQSLGISRPGSPGSSSGTATPKSSKKKSPKLYKQQQLDIAAVNDALAPSDISSVASLPHPYEYEIKHIDYPSQLFEITEPQQPGDWDSTPFEFVDTPEKLQEMMDHLESSAHEIAVDLEHHNYRSYQGFTCLVQVSSRTRDFVIDSLALRSELHCLNEVTADPTRIKVFHGAESDIEWLQRDFGVYVVGLFDTYHATKVLNMPHHSLAYLLKTYVDFDADKKYQLADWRIRPIPAEMMKYARADTHFLLYVFDRLRNELLGRGERLVGEDISNPNAEHFGELSGLDVVTSATQPMELTLSKSANTAMNKYEKDGYDVENGLGGGGWATLLKKWHHPFSPTQLAVYRALHKWRDSCAREEDESTRYVLPNHMLFAISDRMPEDAPALFAACQPTPPLVRLYASDIITLIRGERTAAESRLSDMKEFIQQAQNEQDLASKPVHTRFEDQDGDLNSDGGIADDMDVDDKIPSVSDDVLTKDLLESVADMIVPVSGLFGDSVSVSMVSGASDTAATDDAEASSPEARKAKNKALEIRSNLVLTVAVPKSVITREEDSMDVDEHSFVVAEKRKAAEKAYIEADSKKGPAQPMIISETYAKYQPERKSKSTDDDEKVKQKDAIDLDMPKISLGDIVDASDDEANEDSTPAKKRAKKSKGKNKSKSRGGVKSEDVTPFDYSKAAPDSTQGGDVIGKSTVTLDDSKKAKRAARNRDKKAKTKARDTFDPYAQVTTTADLAKKPNRPRVNAKSGNRSMSFKK